MISRYAVAHPICSRLCFVVVEFFNHRREPPNVAPWDGFSKEVGEHGGGVGAIRHGSTWFSPSGWVSHLAVRLMSQCYYSGYC